MDRREALKLSLLAGAGLAVGSAPAGAAQCEGDGTPMQFIPKKAADA
ncbi:MAG: twin-arginine translocation pathway signal protein, partial [Rhodocyclales bacterium]|nr:twin-arginine translocation pathway signal protein [Rhodocyclales bacterium]